MTDIPNLRKTEAEWREIITETMTRRVSYIDGIWDILRAYDLILPDPESDLLKEAREICAQREEECGYTFDAAKFRMGNEDDSFAMRCTLAALKHRKDN